MLRSAIRKYPEKSGYFRCIGRLRLFVNLRNNASANSTSTFADSEVKTLVHSDRSKKLDLEGDSITRHDHFFVSWEFNLTSYVRSTEVELRLVTLEEWRVTATLFLRQDVDFCVKLSVRSNAT